MRSMLPAASGRRMSVYSRLAFSVILPGFLAAAMFDGALAQGRNPFDIGISEGGGVPGSSLAQWIWTQQIVFERMLSVAVSAVRTDSLALWSLISIAFAYGVFHAAGPGHGKAVVASYMIANEQVLKRGILISFLAAILQALVAIAIVTVLAVILNATAARMKFVSGYVEAASYLAIALLGLWLVWRKGRALWAFSRAAPALPEVVGVDHLHSEDSELAPHGHGHSGETHVHDAHCGHFHAPDPAKLGSNFSRGAAVATIFAAGLRPCSGAILVLVFSFAQGIFFAGIAAALAMALGTAITTGALAAAAVLAKTLARRYLSGSGSGSGFLAIAVPAMELLAAAFILSLGLLLFTGTILR